MDYAWQDYIAKLAYYKWEAAGRPEGMADYFWLEAETEFYDMLRNSEGDTGPFPYAE